MTVQQSQPIVCIGNRADRPEIPNSVSSQNGYTWIDGDSGAIMLQLNAQYVAYGRIVETTDNVNGGNTPLIRAYHRLLTTGPAAVNGEAGSVEIWLENSARATVQALSIRAVETDVTPGSEDSRMDVSIKINGTDTVAFSTRVPSAADGDLSIFGLQRTSAGNYALVQLTSGANDSGGPGFRQVLCPNI